jgi:hypothetical protein
VGLHEHDAVANPQSSNAVINQSKLMFAKKKKKINTNNEFDSMQQYATISISYSSLSC